MKKGILLLAILCGALIIAVASYSGLGQVCSDAVELEYIDQYVANLLGTVSKLVSALEDPQADSFIRGNDTYAYLPHEAVIVAARVSDAKDARYLEENVRNTLNRVGDLALSLIGDTKLVILIFVGSFGFDTYGYFLLDKKALQNPASCKYKTFTDKDQSTLEQLGIFADLLGAELPGNTAFGWAYYIPGFGGYVSLGVDYAPELLDWTCEDWKTYLAGNLEKASDALFDSFGEGETLALLVHALYLQYPKRPATLFVINKNTAPNPAEWEVYFR